ncbi:M24 family metallopeptidase [Aliiroseovarius sp. 2305UL8-7]|uniref:M24 family metallopeptidase n=1 Tax=Aliiroseovarius conchicola TaxID=3121637 RepID=UPI0035274DFE
MSRINHLRQTMAEHGVDLVALGPNAHLTWLLDVHPHGDERPLLLCVTQTYAGFLMPSLEAESARPQTDLPFHTWSDADGPDAAFAELLLASGATTAKSIVLDETMRADFAGLVQDALPNAKRQFTQTTVDALRMRKDTDEYGKLKRNAVSADTAMKAAWSVMKTGMSELQVADVIRDSFASQDVKPLFTVIGAGSNGAFPHHHTGKTILKDGDAVVMDIGGGKDGYSSDMTRMAVMGTPPDGYAELHAIVEAAVQAAMAAAKPGVKAHVVDDAARGVITEAGYGDYFVHRTGHGMGVEIHETPYITAASQTVLEEGMVFSIEPGIYLPGRFGIRLEDIVILRADGPEILSDLPRDLKIING